MCRNILDTRAPESEDPVLVLSSFGPPHATPDEFSHRTLGSLSPPWTQLSLAVLSSLPCQACFNPALLTKSHTLSPASFHLLLVPRGYRTPPSGPTH